MDTRAFSVSVPLVFSLFNPYYLVVASMTLVTALYYIDRAPDTQLRHSEIHVHRPGVASRKAPMIDSLMAET